MPVLSTFGAIAARGFGWIGALASGNTGLFAWGDNSYGQLGTGNTVGRSSPVQVGALTTWTKVACGANYTMALKSDGTLWGWGFNSEGNLGTGGVTTYSSPVQIGALTTWSKLHPHGYTTHVIKTDGTLWGWGQGYYGMIGNGTTINYSSPIQIGALTTWALVSTGSVGFLKTVAVKTDGTLWVWGWRQDHTTGGTGAGGSDGGPYSTIVSTLSGGPVSIDLSSPVQIGAATNWATTASGLYHSLAITTSGTLYAWGSHTQGQLGVGTLNNNPDFWTPTAATSGGFCVGPYYTYYEAPANDSITGVFGNNASATICDASYVNWNFTGANTVAWGHSSPVQVGALTTWSKVAGGYYHSASIKTDGTLWAWGVNNFGQLGTNTTTNYSSPVQIGALTTWANVTCGVHFTIAVKTDGTLWSWGFNAYGSLGLGDLTSRSSPVQVGTKTNWLSTGFSASAGSTLAIRS